MQQYIIFGGRVCPIVSVGVETTEGKRVDIVSGVRERRAKAGSRPGRGWRPVRNKPRNWVKHEKVVTKDVLVTHDQVLSEYPVATESSDVIHPESAYDEIITSIMQVAVKNAGARGRRIMPEVQHSLFNDRFQRDGMVLLPDEILSGMITRAWESLKPKRRKPKQVKIEGRTILPEPKKNEESEDVAKSGPPDVKEPESDTSSEDDGKPVDNGEPDAENSGKPTGVKLDDGEVWSEKINVAVPIDELEAMESAFDQGWPPEAILDGATSRKKGPNGYTLAFMSKNEFDADKFTLNTED